MTAVTLLSVVYILYIFSQFTYFSSAFGGILPEEYTYAEYARRGFFEMLPLTGLNLGIIALLNLFTLGKEDKKKALCLKGYTTFILIFNLFIIATALAKMSMYMGIYGLTMRRVFVSWVLILGVVIFILIGIKIYREQFKLNKYLFISFCILYLGLNYINVDYLIGDYNLKLYQVKQVNTRDSFDDLSLSAFGAYMELATHNPVSEHDSCPSYHYQYLLYSGKDWRENNMTHYLGMKQWKEWQKTLPDCLH